MTARRLMLRAGALLAGTVAAATMACGPKGPAILPPEVGLTQVVVRGVGLSGGSLDLVLSVANPNPIDLRVLAVDAGLDVERGHVGEIHTDAPFLVPASGTGAVTLPLRFTWAGAGDAFRSALGYGDIPFLFRGQVAFDVQGHVVKVPFTREGRVPLSKTLSIPLGGPAPPKP